MSSSFLTPSTATPLDVVPQTPTARPDASTNFAGLLEGLAHALEDLDENVATENKQSREDARCEDCPPRITLGIGEQGRTEDASDVLTEVACWTFDLLVLGYLTWMAGLLGVVHEILLHRDTRVEEMSPGLLTRVHLRAFSVGAHLKAC